ncbi:4-hydroxy-2-oxovalerate aldolase [Pseudomonadota bacterium]
MAKHIDILDTTLRDGSYTINYQFTAEETAFIAKGLELSGVDYIEVGHGLGLGADRAGKGTQAATDQVYMRACADAICKSKFGFFYIPGIGNPDDLKLLADQGGKFVRIGTALESADQAFHVMELAKALDLEVWVNVMKTYAYPLDECAARMNRFVDAGARGVYVVDSAGGMLPADVARYVTKIKESFDGRDARIGFHGHDNLAMASACSLAAVEAGCDIVDGSLLGIGRSVGNAATEVLAMVLARAGYETGVNAWHAADLAEKTIRPFLMQRWRNNSLDQALGYTQVHSGFLPLLEASAKEKGVGVRDVVLALGSDAKLNISENDAMSAAEAVRERVDNHSQGVVQHADNIHDINLSTYPFDVVESDLAQYAAGVKSQSLRMARPSAIVISGPWQNAPHKDIKFQQIRLLPNAVVGAIELRNAEDLERVKNDIDGKVEFVFLDKTPRPGTWDDMVGKLEAQEWSSRVLPYADEVAGLIGACRVVAVKAEKMAARKIAILGEDKRAELIRTLIPYWGLKVVEAESARIIIISGDFTNHEAVFKSKAMLVYDLMSGGVNATIAQKLLSDGIELIRLDGHAAVAGDVSGMLEAQVLADEVLGRREINNVSVVAGGVWGAEGDVVVNSMKEPTRVIGIADGNGKIKRELSDAEFRNLDKVRKALRAEFFSGLMGSNY